MVANTAIQWATHTFNPWIGCTKISVGPQGGCEKCYAEVATPSRTMHIEWGAGRPRHRTSLAYWRQPISWNAEAAASGVRPRVFCASLADVFDNEVDPAWRADLFRLIQQTPHLDWLLLTKRIGNARQMLNETMVALHHSSWDQWPWTHVWLGATVVNQEEADRDIPKLLSTPAAVRFLSCEPLLGLIDLRRAGAIRDIFWDTTVPGGREPVPRSIDWLICGGESGSGAREMQIDWARSLRAQCADAGVAFFMKQIGGVRDKRGRLEDFPPDLRVREFPKLKGEST